jgi:hypothetical protein
LNRLASIPYWRVVDPRSMAAFYARIGRRTGDWIGPQTFETEAASNAEERPGHNCWRR